MTEYWLAAIAPIIAVLVFCLAAHKQNREADKQGGRNHASAQIGFGRNSFRKEPEELYTEFYRHMKGCAETSGGEEIELAYLTFPAAYGKSKKDKITAAAKAAGLFHTELVDEPTAAAMCYCAAGFVKDQQNLLIYDFGGGTFDVSVIRYEDNTFRPLAVPKGLERCGGIDIDRLIFQDMLSKVNPDTLQQLQQNTMPITKVQRLLYSAAVCRQRNSKSRADSAR